MHLHRVSVNCIGLGRKCSRLRIFIGKFMRIVFLASLAASLIGLYFYFSGPEIRVTSIFWDKLYDFTLLPSNNETMAISPFANAMLTEYYVLGLSNMLLNRTVDIMVEAADEVDLYVVNATQLKEGRISEYTAELYRGRIEKVNLSFSPSNKWQTYYLVVLNNRNNNISAHVRIRQEFVAKRPIYTNAFNWLKVGLLGILLSFILQVPLRLTVDDMGSRILGRILPTKYRKYVKAEEARMLIFHTIIAVTSILAIGEILILEGRLNEFHPVTKDILNDYFYRLFITFFLTALVLSLIFEVAEIFWRIFYCILLPKAYPNVERYRYSTSMNVRFLKEAILHPYSILFHVGLGFLAMLILLATGNGFALYIAVLAPPYVVYLSYIVSLAYLKTQKKVASNPFNDFKLLRIGMGSAIVISIILVYGIHALVPFLSILFKNILDKSILFHGEVKELIFSKDVIDYIRYLEPYLAYSVPLVCIAIYYLTELFSIAYLPRKKEFQDVSVPRSLLREAGLELLFFIAVFLLSLWLESLLINLCFHYILIALLSSFIASFFRNYLEFFKE